MLGFNERAGIWFMNHDVTTAQAMDWEVNRKKRFSTKESHIVHAVQKKVHTEVEIGATGPRLIT